MAGKLGLGIDFGGTKVLAGVVDLETGRVLGISKKKSRAGDGPDELMERLTTVADEALAAAMVEAKDVAGIGIGIAGQVDPSKGILLGTPNLSQATVNMPIAPRMTEHFGIPTELRNDVQIAAIGEARFGAGKDAPDFLCVFVGTGIGGAVVQKGEILRGAGGSAGEIGHLIVHADGRWCGCGGRGHLEAYASRTAITKSVLGELKRGRQTILSELISPEEAASGAAIRSGILRKAVDAGDELVLETINEMGHYLGLGLASAMNLISPSRIVLGGGVIEAIDLLFDVAVREAKNEALPAAARAVEIVRAGLGDNSGVVGAAIIGGEARR